MASNVFPMLSSSPPPIDDCPDDDEDDDEFGNFTSANIPFDSSFDSPVAVEKFKSFKPGDNGVNDANFSDNVHKFNSFSNSATPSPQEFVPDFTEENGHCKNGFNPIRTEYSVNSKGNFDTSSGEDSDSLNKLEVTSHIPVPPKLEPEFHSSNDSKCSPSEGCDSQLNSALNETIQIETDKEKLNFENEFNSPEQPVCDPPNDEADSPSHYFCDNKEAGVTYEEPKQFISDSKTDFPEHISDVDRISYNEDINLSSDKFECDFNFENLENSTDLNGVSKSLCSPNHEKFSNFKLPHDKFPDEGTSNRISESDLDSNLVHDSAHEFSDNEFDDFQSCGEKLNFVQNPESVEKSNDFNEFQDFQFSNNPSGETDDFADFQDFNAANVDSTDDFADFSAVPFDSNKISESTESCEFADFEEASFPTPEESSFQTSSSSQKNTDPLSTVINAIFPLSESQDESNASDETSPQILEQTNKSRRLWEKLHEVEQTPGLRFQWSVSHSFQQLLRSVNVDYHSILRTSSVPIFASGLSLLEPVKGLSNSANHESEDRNQILKDPISIPPVEFDWNSSGLINPLDSGQAVSTLMDLTFLSSVESDAKVRNNDHSFENELLKPSPPLQCPESSSNTQILEQLLSKNVSSLPNSKTTHRPSDLSKEAVRVLDQLPDLSFMQAKVLMFPISSKT